MLLYVIKLMDIICKLYYCFTDNLLNIFSIWLYNLFFYFSKCQIFLNKINVLPFFNKILCKIKKRSNDQYEYININNGNIITHTNNTYLYSLDMKYDFFIHKKTNNDDICNYLNEKIIYNIDNYNHNSDFEPSNIKFMLIEFYIGKNNYKINLKTDDYNFYLINNKLTKDFFIYYIKNRLYINDNININDECYVKIIDHNICINKIVFTDKNEYILIKKDDYSLHNIII